MRLEFIVNRVFEMLHEVRLGSVVAVWPDGGVSSHRDLAFRHRILPNGMREEPIATFVAGTVVPSVRDIRDRILRATGLASIE